MLAYRYKEFQESNHFTESSARYFQFHQLYLLEPHPCSFYAYLFQYVTQQKITSWGISGKVN